MTAPATASPDYLRNAELPDVAQALRDQQTRVLDVVSPARALHAEQGSIVVPGEPVLTGDGVTTPYAAYRPTGVGLEGIATKLDMPLPYLRKIHAGHAELFDANVNWWLQRTDQSFLLRMLTGDDPRGGGVLRALLSRSYKNIDNFDILLAALNGLKQAGAADSDIRADLTERRMIVRVRSNTVKALAPALLDRYRSPSGESGRDNPVVWAGFVITNSETGGGAFRIVPRLVVQVCTNGMTITRDATKEIHLGGRLDDGIVRYSDATIAKHLDLITAKTADTVATFMDADYVTARLRDMEAQAGRPVTNAPEVVKTVSRRLGFTEQQQTSILDAFVSGGDLTAGGVMHAVTAAAQAEQSGDDAFDLEWRSVQAMELAALTR